MSHYRERSSAAVAQEAELERAVLEHTLDKLRENLQPRNVVNEVMSATHFNSADVSDRVARAARANPLAATIIGIGVAMLFGASRKTRMVADAPPRRWTELDEFPSGATPEPRLNPTTRTDIPGSYRPGPSTREVQPGTFRTGMVADRLFSGERPPAPKPLPVLPRLSSVRRPQTKLARFIDEQPLVLAALGVAVGAAIGAAIPSTDVEAQYLGDASRSVRDNASAAAQAQFAHLKATANQTFEQMKATVAEHGATSENLTGLMHDLRDDVRAGTQAAAAQAEDPLDRG